MREMMKNTKKFIAAFLFMLCALALTHPYQARAQIIDDVTFTLRATPELKKSMYKALEEELADYKRTLGASPWLSFAFVDLNHDGKDEILVNVVDEYVLVDDHGNSYVHGFAQTSRGLIKIFESPAQFIGIESTFGDGLKKIHVFKRPDTKTSTLFVWDGEKQYIEQGMENNE